MNNVHEISSRVFNDLSVLESENTERDIRFASDILDRHGNVRLVELCILANMFGGELKISIEPTGDKRQ